MPKIKPTKIGCVGIGIGKVRMINRCARPGLYQVLLYTGCDACVVPKFGCVCVTFFHNVNQLFTDGTAAIVKREPWETNVWPKMPNGNKQTDKFSVSIFFSFAKPLYDVKHKIKGTRPLSLWFSHRLSCALSIGSMRLRWSVFYPLFSLSLSASIFFFVLRSLNCCWIKKYRRK